MPDYSVWPLECGCIVSWCGRWFEALTVTDECRENHTVDDAIAIAERYRTGELE